MDYSKDANTKKQKNKKATKKKVKNRIGLIITRVIFVVIILIFFAVLGAGMGAYLGIIGESPNVDILQVTPNSYTSYVYDQNGVEIDSLHGIENRTYINMKEIPLNMKNATIAIEDERFYSHNGVDFKGMARALLVNIKTFLGIQDGGIEGASTITQQLIKLNYFKEALQSSEERLSITRKLQEQYMAVQLEKKLATDKDVGKQVAKDYILEVYLNTINYNGAWGIQAAAERYFAKNASELTLSECAVLAAIPKNPSKLNPISNPKDNKERQITVLKRMLKQELITQSEYNEAINEDVYAKIQTTKQKVEEESSPHSYYVDQVITDVSKDLQEAYKISRQEAENFIYSKGYKIYTCIDTDMQNIVDEAYKNPKLFPPDDYALEVLYTITVEDNTTKKSKTYEKREYVKNEEEANNFAATMKSQLVTDNVTFLAEKIETTIQPQSAFIVTDYHTGEVKAVMGGRGEKTGNRLLNRATQSVRQPGSTFKVLAGYAPGIDTGVLTAATTFNDTPYTKGSWSPGNWYSGYKGINTVRTGIADSMNIIAAKAISKVGISTSFDYLLNFGFTTLVDSDERNGKIYSDKNDTIVLGGLTDGVTLSQLNSAYGTIANMGQYLKPIFYTKVIDHDGKTILENIPEPKTVLKETTSFILTDMMEDVITGSVGTGKAAKFKNIKMPIAGKTGTTSEDKDLMFAAYTPYYVASTWLGHDQARSLSSNSNYHMMMWREIMENIHQQKNLEYKKFERPEGIVSANVCNVSGKSPVSGLCDSESRGSRVISEYFASGTVPSEKCDVHVRVSIDTTTNLLATDFCPKEYIASVVMIERPNDGNSAAPDSKYYAPTGTCNVHSSENMTSEESNFETEGETVFIPPIVVPDDNTNSTISSQNNTTSTNSSTSTTKASTTKASTKSTEIPVNKDKIDTPPAMDDFIFPE